MGTQWVFGGRLFIVFSARTNKRHDDHQALLPGSGLGLN
jgi:hypothetical protein